VSGVSEALQAHLDTGATHLCRCWAVVRSDGQTLGFTDHDRALEFDGIRFEAGSGLTATAIEQSTGLSVDNSEAVGALSHAAISERDIRLGRYDGAAVQMWLVNWSDTAQRRLQFSGTIGEIRRDGVGFRAELRGLAEALNRPFGRFYQKGCSAVLGDGRCGVDLGDPAFAAEGLVSAVAGGAVLTLEGFGAYADGWFERGVLHFTDGTLAGVSGVIKNDRLEGDVRQVELWEKVPVAVPVGAAVRLVAGCDKRAETCRVKFLNLANFQGFPFLPGDDWMTAVPQPGEAAHG